MQYIKFQGSRKFLNISLQCRLKGNRLCHLGSNLKKKYKEKVNKKNTAFWKQAIKQHELPKVKNHICYSLCFYFWGGLVLFSEIQLLITFTNRKPCIYIRCKNHWKYNSPTKIKPIHKHKIYPVT